MVKGHNKRGGTNDPNPEEKAKGQERHKTNKEKNRDAVSGRNANPDPSEGRKKENNI